MKIFKHKHVFLVLALLFILPLMFVGCKGSDGSDGAPGTPGTPGTNGTPGTPGTNGTNAGTFGKHNLFLGAVDQAVSNVAVSNVGGVPKISFHVATAAGPVTTLAATQIRAYLADLVPAGVVSAATGSSYSTAYFDQWASETSSTPGITFDNSDAANGNYSWTFSSAFGAATAGSGLNVADYNAAHVQRLVLRVSGVSGSTNNAVAIQDFMVPAAGATATALTPQRVFATIDTCKKCHSQYMDNAAHADSYPDTRACDICHSPLYGSTRHAVGFMDTANAILPVFIHQIHASKSNPGGPSVEYPVTYPQDIKNCVTCHADPNNIGADKINNWKTHPTGRVCVSCHTANTINASGMTHDLTGVYHSAVPSGPKTDAQCTACHSGLGTAGDWTDIVTAHDTTLPPFVAPATGVVSSLTTSDSAEYIVSISTSTPANGQYYVTGETPTVTITLTNNDASHSAVTTSPTTTGGHIVGSYYPNSLSIANMYVYGPRSSPRPSFLPAGKKSVSLMSSYYSASRTSGAAPSYTASNVDANRTATATGWTYQLQPIPSSVLPGTYFVRVYLGNTYTYNIADADPNQVVSFGITSFQVGTATADKRIAGDANGISSCLKCHGSELMHRGDHAAPFDTDDCNACHYIGAFGNTATGGLSSYGDPIANRVHAVHDANPVGDLHGNDWSVPVGWNVEVGSFATSTMTYPSNIERCVVCHASGNTSYKNNLYTVPCYGCHADVSGAGAHMIANGGSLTSEVTVSTSTTNVPESCVVCHSSGKSVDIAD